MRRILVGAAILATLSGCIGRQLSPNPMAGQVEAPPASVLEVNPPESGPAAYAVVFETVLDVLDDYFDIAHANRYDGQIEGQARVAPGLLQLWKTGSPTFYERLLATSQSIRHRAFVLIQPRPEGGYAIHLTIVKELEDLPQPTRERAGAAAFRSDNSVDRVQEVIDASPPTAGWIQKGTDPGFEQLILEKIRRRL
jgi:hypothetical protein